MHTELINSKPPSELKHIIDLEASMTSGSLLVALGHAGSNKVDIGNTEITQMRIVTSLRIQNRQEKPINSQAAMSQARPT